MRSVRGHLVDGARIDPKKPLPGRYLLVAALAMVYVLTAIAVLELQSRALGRLMLVPLFVVLGILIYRLPPNEFAALSGGNRDPETQPPGRLRRVFVAVTLALLALVLMIVGL